MFRADYGQESLQPVGRIATSAESSAFDPSRIMLEHGPFALNHPPLVEQDIYIPYLPPQSLLESHLRCSAPIEQSLLPGQSPPSLKEEGSVLHSYRCPPVDKTLRRGSKTRRMITDEVRQQIVLFHENNKSFKQADIGGNTSKTVRLMESMAQWYTDQSFS